MVEFIKNNDYKDHLTNQNEVNEVTLTFQMKSRCCIPQEDKENYTYDNATFVLNNLKWTIRVCTCYGKLGIHLYCDSETPKEWSCTIQSRLTLIAKSNARILLSSTEHLLEDERKFIKKFINAKFLYIKYKCLLNHYTIDSSYLQGQTVTMDLWINVQPNFLPVLRSNIPLERNTNVRSTDMQQLQSENKLHQRTKLLKTTIDALQAGNEELRHRLACFEEEEENIHIFKEVLRLFKTQQCSQFRREIQLSNSTKLQLQMFPTENGAAAGQTELEPQMDIAGCILNDETISKYELQIKQLKAENDKLKQDKLNLLLQQDQFQDLNPVVEELRKRNEELCKKLIFYEEDKIELTTFKKALRFFHANSCNRFEYELKSITIQLQRKPIEDNSELCDCSSY